MDSKEEGEALKRLGALLVVVAGGLWLWQGAGGWFLSKRTLTCTLKDAGPLTQLEFQLWHEETLLFRAVRQNPNSHALTQEVQLKPGRYGVQLLTWTSLGQAPRVYKQILEVGGQKEFHLGF